jgi:Tol biopolymer transport system component
LEDAPSISPDGKRLAFVSSRDGNAEIFVMPFRPEGAEAAAVNLSNNPGAISSPPSPRTVNRSPLPAIATATGRARST